MAAQGGAGRRRAAQPSGPRLRSLLIVHNPAAGRAPAERALIEAAAPLRAAGAEVELRPTAGPGHARELAAAAARGGVDAVVAAGGDGTIHEVANGLAGSGAALAAVRGGTANVWAREAGAPRDPARALRLLATARRVRIDLGVAEPAGGPAGGGARRFLLMCSAGLDAETVRRVGEGGRAKRWFGRAWYALAGAERALRAPAVRARIRAGETAIERPLLLAVAGNTRLYGGVARLTGAARADDGLLDLAAFSARGPLGRLRTVARGLRGGLRGDLAVRAGGGIDYLRAARIRIEPDRPLAVQADGEYLGETPLALGVEPRALDVLIAPGPNPLLADG